MPVHLNPEMERKLDELAAQTGRPASELLEDAMAGYLDELNGVRDMLDRRLNDLESGRVQSMDGEEALARLRDRSARRRDRPA